jgi:uncharacterized protein YndB with AHSA1/START domain
MKVIYKPEQEVTSAAVQKATGQSMDAWFAELDTRGGVTQGRKALSDYLFKEKKVDAWWTVTLAVEYEKARGAVEKDALIRGYGICVTKSIAAPPAKVYAALLDAKSWMGPNSTAALKEGGAWDDGDGHSGVFKRLAPGKTMKFSWAGKGHQNVEEVEIKFTAAGAKTSVVLNHSRLPDRAAADGMRAAWARVLDAIKEKVE